MMTLLFVLCTSSILCLVLTPMARVLARRIGLLDSPDGRRKAHGKPIPVAGGLAIFLSLTLTLAAVMFIPNKLSEGLAGRGEQMLGLFLAAVVLCTLGVVDDFGWLRGRFKLLGQIGAVLLVVNFGVIVRTIRIFDWNIDLGPFAVPLTALWLVGAINALNLIDGMDGLLSSVGFVLSAAMASMAIMSGKWEVACVATAMAGALLGFLRYNFPPATIFLGDSGSMLIGLVVGTLAIQGSLKGPATVAMAAPVALLTIPFFDTAAAIIRRKLTGRSIYTTDRGHLHHCLLRRGYSNWRVLASVSVFCLLTVAGALASLAFGQEIYAVLTALAVVSILIVTQMFGHAEFTLVRKQFASKASSLWRRGGRNQPRQTEVRLQGSVNWAELWEELIGRAHWHNLKMVRLNVNAPALQECYHARWDCPHEEGEENDLWRAEIPLRVHEHLLGRLEIVGQRDKDPVSKKAALVMQLVEDFEAAASELVSPTSHAVPKIAPVIDAPPSVKQPINGELQKAKIA